MSILFKFWNGGNDLGSICDHMSCFWCSSQYTHHGNHLVLHIWVQLFFHLEPTSIETKCSLFLFLLFCLSSVSRMPIDSHFPDNTLSSACQPVLILKTRMRYLTTTKYTCELYCFLVNYFLIATIKQRTLWYEFGRMVF